MLPYVSYMHWAKTVPHRVRYNLSASGIPLLATADELGLGTATLRLAANNVYGYGPLRDVVAARYGCGPEHVFLSQGTSLANFVVMQAALKPGDRVLVERPTYEPILAALQACGARVERFDRRADDGWKIDVDAVGRQATGAAMIVVCSLHNPSGAEVTDENVAALQSVADATGALLMIDEVYRDFIADRPLGTAFRPGTRTIATSSLTKVYGIGSLRIGWALADADLVERAYRMNDCMAAVTPVPTDYFGWHVFASGGADLLRARAIARAEENWTIVRAFLESRAELSWTPPRGGIIVFARFRDGSASTPFVDALFRDHSTSVVPGTFFEDPVGFRLCFGIEKGVLVEALGQIGSALDAR